MTARLTDNLSGVAYARVDALSPDRSQLVNSNFQRQSGTALDGIYTATLTIPRYAEQGTWTLDNIQLQDVANNLVNVSAADLTAAGLPTTFQNRPLNTTSTTLTASSNPTAVGSRVTFTATVTPSVAGGTVSFSDNAAPVTGCKSVPVSGSSAACSVTYGATGQHTVVATYSGTTGFAASTSPSVTEVVSKTPCATLAGCNLSGEDLSGANLSGANLSGANLTGANLANANLTKAHLTQTNLNGANLAGANLTGANLSGANLNKVVWSNTICPDATNSDSHGNTCVGHL